MLAPMSASPRPAAPGAPPTDPLAQFTRWFEEAQAVVPEADAMALATATPDGRPSVRYVLFRGMSDGGLRFFTNLDSRKGDELAANPRAAAAFFWQPLGRQARVEGRIEKLPAAEDDAYFAARPRGHQLAALASPQSRPIGHQELLARYAALEAEYAGAPVPRPARWGGFRLVPALIELWQRKDNRLHERTAFVRDGQAAGGWRVEPLGP
jgi:pyridoxamine 5'-phosphate oxidase